MDNELTVVDFKFVEHNEEAFISGVEICRKLGYADPTDQARIIWKRHKEVLNAFSVEVKIPATDGKTYKTRSYNEHGALFFISKCHIEAADKITVEMIGAFLKLRDMITKYDEVRGLGKLKRRSLTDTIKNEIPDSPNKKFKYKHFTDLVYKYALGMSAKQYREENRLDKDANVRDYVTKGELQLITNYEEIVRNLMLIGVLDYSDVSSVLEKSTCKQSLQVQQ